MIATQCLLVCISMYTIFIGLLTVILLFLYYLKKRNDYWKIRDVPHEKAKLLVGNMWDAFCQRKNSGEIFDYFYKKFHDFKYCGVMNFGQPTLVVIDPELVERIFIKDFSKFHDNGFVVDEKKDLVASKSPFFAKGDLWKTVRNQLTPQFSPLKIKNMFPLMDEVKDRLVNYLRTESNAKKKEGLDAKVLMEKYTNEMVASCAFGLNADCFNNDKAEILELNRSLFQFGTADIIVLMITLMFPIMSKFFIPRILSLKITEGFKKIILTTLKERQEKGIRRGDFLDAIVEMKQKTSAGEYTSDYMTAHAISFFSDGSQTSATVLQYTLYELAKNKHVQQKLREEFEKALKENGGKMNSDVLQNIEYLEMIIYESLRLHPPVLFLLKECTETTTWPQAKEVGPELVVQKGTLITIPVISLHKDPQYYDDPEKFIPERFSNEAKVSQVKITYLGFGDGPRICIGRRFAMAVIKVALFGILTNFEVELNEKTPTKLELDPIQLLYTTKGGIWLNFYPIN